MGNCLPRRAKPPSLSMLLLLFGMYPLGNRSNPCPVISLPSLNSVSRPMTHGLFLYRVIVAGDYTSVIQQAVCPWWPVQIRRMAFTSESYGAWRGVTTLPTS
uniref:Secreted protein n=1 Tax=Cacopsylla melanoneura TaxID=428564 RepID=A0A8D8VJU2_9HEMI